MRTFVSLIFIAGSLCGAAPPHYFVTTFAGTTPPLANPIAARQYLDTPTTVAYDPHGNLYYANFSQVWRLNPDGTDTLIAGRITPGGANTGLAIDAAFTQISSMAFDPQGNLYIADGAIWKMTTDQKISMLLPIRSIYFEFGAFIVATDAAGNLYAAGYSGAVVMKYEAANQRWSMLAQVVPNDILLSIAVSGSVLYLLDTSNYYKVLQVDMQTGKITTAFQVSASEETPSALAVGPDGTVYIASSSKIFQGKPPSGVVQPFAGTGVSGFSGDGGRATLASIAPAGFPVSGGSLAVNSVTGDVAIAEFRNHVFRAVSGATQLIQTVAGEPHFAGDNGPAVLARFDATSDTLAPSVLAADGAGNLYFFDRHNARIRKITPSGTISTVVGNGIPGYSGDGGKATQASIDAFYGRRQGGNIAADKAGNLYFVSGSVIRMVDLNGNIRTVAGGGSAPITDGVQATSVALSTVQCVAADSSGNFYFSQYTGSFHSLSQIFKVSASGKLSLFAGTGNFGGFNSSPDGTPASQAQLGYIGALAVSSSGVVYFQDTDLIRTVDLNGNLVTIAGKQSVGVFHDDLISAGPATSTYINPTALAVDQAGNVYFTNSSVYGPQVAVIDTVGNLTPIAGNPPASGPGETSNGDGGDALKAGFADAIGLALDLSGNVYVLDSGSYIRKLSPFTPGNPPPFLSTGGVIGSGGSLPAVQAVSPNGDATIYGANFGATHTLQASELVNGKIPTTLVGVCVSFGGVPAAILGVYPSQINVQVPTLPYGPVAVQVTLNCGTSKAVASNLAGVIMQAATPEFFTFLPDPAAGNNPIAAVNALTGALIGPPGLLAGATFAPVGAGDIVAAYGTGWGATNPPLGLGVIPGAAFPLSSPYTLTLAGTNVPASNILYAGAAPCCAGLYQVNFTVPAGTPTGNQPLVITVAGVPSPSRAFITLK